MKTLLETKLSASDRSKLSDEDFGVPAKRQFPLHDEEHVRKAIQYFSSCDFKDRGTLAFHINRKLQERDMHIKVAPTSMFYKFMNKKYLAESSSIVPSSPCLNSDLIYTKEHETVKRVLQLGADPKMVSECIGINKGMRDLYDMYFEARGYITGTGKTILYDLLDDIIDYLCSPLDLTFEGYNTLYGYCDQFGSFNTCYILRKLCEVKLYRLTMDKDKQFAKQVNDFMSIDELISKYSGLISTGADGFNISYVPDQIIFNNFKNIPLNRSIEFFEKMRNENVLQLDIISTCDKVRLGINQDELTDAAIDEDGEMIYIINHINGLVNPEIFEPKLNTRIIYADRMLLQSSTEYKDLHSIDDIAGNTNYITKAASTGICYLVTKCEAESCFYLIEVRMGTCPMFTDKLAIGEGSKFNCKKLKFHSSKKGDIEDDLLMVQLTEGISINEQGDIKIKITPKKSYMDYYSENHLVLIENYKNENYEAVKQNLGFIFALIEMIERDPLYKKRDAQVMKARSFAINDFKTYLKKVQLVDPTFDFVKYYKDNDFETTIIDIPVSTIVGIKNLLKAIMAG